MLLFIFNKTIRYKSNYIRLTDYESKMLECLLIFYKQNSGDYQSLIQYIWKERECVVSSNTVSQLAHRLRNRFRKNDIPITINVSRKNGCSIAFTDWGMVIMKPASLLTTRLLFVTANREAILVKWRYKIN